MQACYQLTLFADYFQFILQDIESEDDFGTIWTPEAFKMGSAFGKTAVCPGTLRNVDVNVELHICESEPIIDLSTYDHAVEGSIELPTGTLMVMGCTGYLPEAARFNLVPGTYRVLALMQGIESIKNEWEPAGDLYPVFIWHGNAIPPRVLKHWKGDA
jgi:hypothetical protein